MTDNLEVCCLWRNWNNKRELWLNTLKCAVAVKFAKSNLVRAIKDSVYIKSLLVFCLDDSITVTLSHRVARIRRVLRGKLNGWKTTEDDDDKILKLPAFLRGHASGQPLFCYSHATARYISDSWCRLKEIYVQPRPCSRTFMSSLNAVIYA